MVSGQSTMTTFLQSYVFPVCTYSNKSGAAFIEKSYGTGFQISSAGFGITAKHVLEAAIAEAAVNNFNVGVVGKANAGTEIGSVVAPVQQYEFAPTPYDVAILQTNYRSETLFTMPSRSIEVWQEVAAIGYPLNAISGDPKGKRLNIRAQRGHIQRMLTAEDWPFGESPKAFELSFQISQGMSGSPLFVHAQPKDILIGICTSSFRSELIDAEVVELEEDGLRRVERVVKIEEFGVAQDIRDLSDWRPHMLNGRSLSDMLNE